MQGDYSDRYLVRLLGMKQSLRIIEECLDKIPKGLVKNNDLKITPPYRYQTKKSMEALIHYFKNYINGVFSILQMKLILVQKHPKVNLVYF